jgi:hypothetical protein
MTDGSHIYVGLFPYKFLLRHVPLFLFSILESSEKPPVTQVEHNI